MAFHLRPLHWHALNRDFCLDLRITAVATPEQVRGYFCITVVAGMLIGAASVL